MIVALAERITGYLVSKNIITEEEYDVYEYGYELLASSLLGVSLIIVSSIILDCLDIAVFFLCVFCGVRTFTGGSASWFTFHQPKEPKELEKYMEKIDLVTYNVNKAD